MRHNQWTILCTAHQRGGGGRGCAHGTRRDHEGAPNAHVHMRRGGVIGPHTHAGNVVRQVADDQDNTRRGGGGAIRPQEPGNAARHGVDHLKAEGEWSRHHNEDHKEGLTQ